jgi:hypothetical protein
MPKRLLDDKILILNNGMLLIAEDFVFGSPSAAAAAVLDVEQTAGLNGRIRTAKPLTRFTELIQRKANKCNLYYFYLLSIMS